MKRLALYFPLVSILMLAGCDFGNPWDYSNPARISFGIRGGIVGANQEMVIDENGLAEFTQGYHPKEYVVHYKLTPMQLDSLKEAFKRAGFVALPSKYKSKQQITDGVNYSINYALEGFSKTVVVESGAVLPKGLWALLEQLRRTNEIILQNADFG